MWEVRTTSTADSARREAAALAARVVGAAVQVGPPVVSPAMAAETYLQPTAVQGTQMLGMVGAGSTAPLPTAEWTLAETSPAAMAAPSTEVRNATQCGRTAERAFAAIS
jgi:hypothetical protein